MTDRLESTHPQVLAVLLDALADRQPAPKAPKWEREHETGLAATTWHPCPNNCDNGQTTWKGRPATCTRCNGKGGWNTDPYDNAHKPITSNSRSEWTLPELARRLCTLELKELERLTPTANGNGSLEHDLAPTPQWVERLLTALQELALVAPSQSRAITWKHLDKLPLGITMSVVYQDALEWLAFFLGPTFNAPPWAITRALENLRQLRADKAKDARWPDRDLRDAEIRRAAAQGRSERWMVKNLGVSKGVINRAKEAA